jgi:hypothetical protein
MSAPTVTAMTAKRGTVRLAHGRPSAAHGSTRTGTAASRNRLCSNVYGVHVAGRRLSRVRLTARGRVLIIGWALIMTMLGLGVVGALRAEAAGEGASPAPAGWHMIVVQPNDTLWGIARDVAPAADPRAIIDELRAVNDLSGSALHVGTRLWVPAAL